ncbi:MAG: hypothetical protein LBU36_05430 [Clostridiales bacterium]|jgi:hypothetical protein|nr:hypothetical protein [Clostridiales bacterium]
MAEQNYESYEQYLKSSYALSEKAKDTTEFFNMAQNLFIMRDKAIESAQEISKSGWRTDTQTMADFYGLLEERGANPDIIVIMINMKKFADWKEAADVQICRILAQHFVSGETLSKEQAAAVKKLIDESRAPKEIKGSLARYIKDYLG